MGFEDREIGLEDIARIVSKNWKLILIPTILATLVSVIYALCIPKTYESYALVRIGFDGNGQFETTNNVDDIMHSIPMLKEIARRAGSDKYREFNGLSYENASGLLRVVFQSNSFENAAKVVDIATSILIERHQALYAESRRNTNDVVKFVKETIKPVPLSSGIREFRIVPTSVIIPPIANNEPLRSNKKIIIMATFILSLLVMIMTSFYLEGRKNKKS